MDKIRQIETFLAVLRCGSFAAAAAEQNVTPVMIGKRIAQLEARLGGRLFHRSTRRLDLTGQGAVFAEHCARIVKELESAERRVSDATRRATGHLVVTAAAGFGRQHIVPHLDDFLECNPDVRISLNLSDQVMDLVRAGYDLGIRFTTTPDPTLTAVNLLSSFSMVCGSPDYFARNTRPEMPEDLASHNCLTFNRHGGQPGGWHFMRAGRQLSIRPDGNLDCNDAALLKQWALEGLGLAWLPNYVVAAELASGALLTVLDDYVVPGIGLMAVYPRQRTLPAKTALFIEWLKSVYSRPDYWTGSFGEDPFRATAP